MQKIDSTAFRERPILFSGEMVRAILDGRKTQTRRVMKLQPGQVTPAGRPLFFQYGDTGRRVRPVCPYGQPDDRLWVRETFAIYGDKEQFVAHYRASHPCPTPEMRWKPSIHMPRFASRITLEITGVRVERLKAISATDAKAEGLSWDTIAWGVPGSVWWDRDPRVAYRYLWESINGAGSWDANPWVWVIEFRRVGV